VESVSHQAIESREVAKGRLHLVLAHDRVGLEGGKLQEMRREIAAVISKYVPIDLDAVESRSNKSRAPSSRSPARCPRAAAANFDPSAAPSRPRRHEPPSRRMAQRHRLGIAPCTSLPASLLLAPPAPRACSSRPATRRPATRRPAPRALFLAHCYSAPCYSRPAPRALPLAPCSLSERRPSRNAAGLMDMANPEIGARRHERRCATAHSPCASNEAPFRIIFGIRKESPEPIGCYDRRASTPPALPEGMSRRPVPLHPHATRSLHLTRSPACPTPIQRPTPLRSSGLPHSDHRPTRRAPLRSISVWLGVGAGIDLQFAVVVGANDHIFLY